MPSLVEIGRGIMEKKDENVKSLQTDRQMDYIRQTTGDQKSLVELSAQMS